MDVFECPHCGIGIEIENINCGIFRCGISKESGYQINPHTPKEDCDRMIKECLIWGCGKPFKVVYENKKIKLVQCEYV